MKAYLWLSLVVMLIVMISIAIFSNVPGHVELSWRGEEYRVSLMTALLLLFSFILFGYLLLRALIGVFSLPMTLSSLWQSKQPGISPTEHLIIGLSAFVSEDWLLACRSLEHGTTKTQPQAAALMLLAARAAMEQGDQKLLSQYLGKAKSLVQDDVTRQALAYLKIISDGTKEGSKPADYIAQLDTFLKEHPKHDEARAKLALLYQAQGDWEKVEELFDKEYLSERQSDVAWQKKIWFRQLDKAVAGDVATRLKKLERIWSELPRTINDDPQCRAHYLQLMGLSTEQNGADLAVQKIEQHMQEAWSPPLARLYGLISGADVEAQLRVATAWHTKHQEDADLALCLGRIYLRQGALVKAGEQLQQAAKQRPGDADICSELARLSAAQGEFAKSHKQLVAAKSS